MTDATQVPGFICFDHVAIAVPPGQLEAQVHAYEALGFTEIHREDVLGTDMVREVLLQVGAGPNLVQLLEPLSPESPVARQIEKNGGRGGMSPPSYQSTFTGGCAGRPLAAGRSANSYCTRVASGYDAGFAAPPPHGVADPEMLVGYVSPNAQNT